VTGGEESANEKSPSGKTDGDEQEHDLDELREQIRSMQSQIERLAGRK
jgi:hypothetical protein